MNASSLAPSCNVTENTSTLIRLLLVDASDGCGGHVSSLLIQMSLLPQKWYVLTMHIVCIGLTISFQTFFLCHAIVWMYEKERGSMHTVKDSKMSHPSCSCGLQKYSIIYWQWETWACFHEHKKGILVNWEAPGSIAVGVTSWAGTHRVLANCLSFSVFDLCAVQFWNAGRLCLDF